MTNIKKLCLICGNVIYLISKHPSNDRKYCGRDCYIKSIKGRKVTWVDKISKARKGHGWPEGYHEKQSKSQKLRFTQEEIWNKGIIYGKARWFWKDKPNEYRNLHKKIRKRFGVPKECELCGRKDLIKYEWANKTGKYLLERDDWLRLCKKCHIEYDGVNKK